MMKIGQSYPLYVCLQFFRTDVTINGMKKYNILTLALVVALSSFFVYYAVDAASTVGTNLSTTGSLAVTGGASFSASFEAVGYASISGNLQFGGSGTHSIGVNSGSGALTINAFTLGGTVTGPLVLTGAASVSTNFEAGGYASISGNLQFGGSGTHSIGVNSGSGALTINAFTLGGAVTGGAQNITGLGNLTSTNASVSNTFEVSVSASISKVFATSNLVGGSATASSSATYSSELVSSAATNSLNFSATGGKGTCLQMTDITGVPVYLRVIAGTTASGSSSHWLVLSTKKCHI